MAMDFSQTNSRKLVNTVMKKVDNTELDNKKRNIDISLIDPNKDNEAIFGLEDIDYLADAIKEDGFSGAIEVYAKDDGRYEIISGHRRYLAMQRNGETSIPCIICEPVDERMKSKILIDKNILSRKMSPLKWAKAIKYYEENVLYDFEGQKRDELAKHFNISGPTIHRYTVLLKLIPEFQVYADKPEFPYYNLYSITKLSKEEQLSLYIKMKEGAVVKNENGEVDEEKKGDISIYSKKLIDQMVNKEIEITQKEKQSEKVQKEFSAPNPSAKVLFNATTPIIQSFEDSSDKIEHLQARTEETRKSENNYEKDFMNQPEDISNTIAIQFENIIQELIYITKENNSIIKKEKKEKYIKKLHEIIEKLQEE